MIVGRTLLLDCEQKHLRLAELNAGDGELEKKHRHWAQITAAGDLQRAGISKAGLAVVPLRDDEQAFIHDMYVNELLTERSPEAAVTRC